MHRIGLFVAMLCFHSLAEDLTGKLLVTTNKFPGNQAKSFDGEVVASAKDMELLLKEIHFQGSVPGVEWQKDIAVVFLHSICVDTRIPGLAGVREMLVSEAATIGGLERTGNKLVLTWYDSGSALRAISTGNCAWESQLIVARIGRDVFSSSNLIIRRVKRKLMVPFWDGHTVVLRDPAEIERENRKIGIPPTGPKTIGLLLPLGRVAIATST
jgi:hypothetical protein